MPTEDRFLRLTEYAPHAMVNGLHDGVAYSYMRVTIDCFSGRSIWAKRELCRQIVDRLAEHDIPRKHVSILLRESAPENWGAGGIAASDYDLGFEINVWAPDWLDVPLPSGIGLLEVAVCKHDA